MMQKNQKNVELPSLNELFKSLLKSIKQVDRDVEGGLFREYKFENNEGQQIFDFMEENASKLREISMRMALKIADLFKVTGVNDWRTLAESTCMKVR